MFGHSRWFLERQSRLGLQFTRSSRGFHSKLKCLLFKNSYPDSFIWSSNASTLALNDDRHKQLICIFWPSGNRTWACPGLPFGQLLWFVTKLVNKLVPCAWLLSGALEIWSWLPRLRFCGRCRNLEIMIRLRSEKTRKQPKEIGLFCVEPHYCRPLVHRENAYIPGSNLGVA